MNNIKNFFDIGDALFGVFSTFIIAFLWIFNQRFVNKKDFYSEISRLEALNLKQDTNIKTLETKLDNVIDLLKETRQLLIKQNKGIL